LIKKLLLTFSVIHAQAVFAVPDKIEVFFLSAEKAASIDVDKLINKIKYSQSITQNCVPMGDGCFHPQFGYMEEAPPVIEATPTDLKINNFHNQETQLVDCKEGYYFDIYCGKAQPVAKRPVALKPKLEIWIDTSASMKTVDYSKDESYCGRRSFVSRVMESCGSDVVFHLFDTSKKEMGSATTTCVTKGSNNQTRLMEWIEETDAHHLIIVTDIDEQSQRLTDFLDKHKAKVHGLGTTTGITTVDLIAYAAEASKSCKATKK
jgi:hypothetical protein